MRPGLILTLLCVVPIAGFCQTHASRDNNPQVRNPIEGGRIFQYYCAACHGADGQGNGHAATAPGHAAPDLTVISRKNSGKFPYSRVKDVIEGTDTRLAAHGDRKMPVWGPIFHEVEADQDWGEVRLDAVTRYIESMQRK